ncbi:AMP-binding protein [Rhizobium helianthi]|uniref:AMP-binding protein n=1 Tax=Rhizobium helianthi TaxID=1132695 RepID=A0ABW4M819_9HYPH
MHGLKARDERPSYQQAVSGFSLNALTRQLSGDLEQGINACVECCDRHCGEQRTALRWIAADGHLATFTFEDLKDMASRIANVLQAQGIRPGDTVAGMLPRTPILIASILATWRLGAVYQPLFTAFGPLAIGQRLKTGATRVLITNGANRAKVSDVDVPVQVLFVTNGDDGAPEGDIDLRQAMASAPAEFDPVFRRGDDLMMLMSTSGTTGTPKGVPVPIRALPSFEAYMRHAVDLREQDVFWNVADPGWAYGLYYSVTGPLLLGCATTFTEAAFNAKQFSEVAQQIGVTNVAGSPTAFRLLMAAGHESFEPLKGQLRVVSSAGEPLNPEVIRWFDTHLSAPIHDHYGQTELGMVVNNHHGLAHSVRPGSAGYAMPGYRVAILDDDGRELGPNQPGILAIDMKNSPLLWFHGYYRQDTPSIANGFYRTGDTVEFEADGSVSFIGRADDVITSSGYRIGPFEVESALIEHPAVVEAAVIGVPDPERTEIVKAFVVLGRGFKAGVELAEELRQHVRKALSAHAYPRLIDFVDELPKTPSGKVQRFMLRKAEIDKLGKKEGSAA